MGAWKSHGNVPSELGSPMEKTYKTPTESILPGKTIRGNFPWELGSPMEKSHESPTGTTLPHKKIPTLKAFLRKTREETIFVPRGKKRNSSITLPPLPPSIGHTTTAMHKLSTPRARPPVPPSTKAILHATRNTSLRFDVGARDVCLVTVKTRHAPSRHCGDARVYGHTTTAMREVSTRPPWKPPCGKKTSLLQRKKKQCNAEAKKLSQKREKAQSYAGSR